MSETPELRWFEAYGPCHECGKRATGILRGSRNESYGPHCKQCAEKRLKASAKVRAAKEPVKDSRFNEDGTRKPSPMDDYMPNSEFEPHSSRSRDWTA